MKTLKQWLAALLVAASILATAGCTRDVNARKQKFLESGNRYLERGKYAEAAIQFQNAIQQDQSFAAAHFQLAKTYQLQKQWEPAFRELSVTVQLEPKNWQAQLEVANFLFSAKQFQDARDRAALILEENPDFVGAQLVMATCDGELGNLTAAIQEAQQAVRMARNKPESYLTLGLLQQKAKNFHEAEQSLQNAVSLNPKFVPARLGLGSFYQVQRQWEQSEAQYKAAIEAEPRNLISRTSLASLYQAWGKKELAEQSLQETKAALPDNPDAYMLLGDFYADTGESQKAIAEFASLYQRHSNDLRVKKRYIRLLLARNQFDLADKLSEEILKQNSRDAEALLDKGQLLLHAEKPAEAVPSLEASLQANPEDPAAHFQLGVAMYKTGNLARAESEWQQSVKIMPSAEAEESLAKLALRKGDLKLLESSASAWIKYAPTAPQAYVLHGLARTREGDGPAAENDFSEAIELAPGNVEAYTRFAELRLAQKRFGEAGRLYEKALSFNAQAEEPLHGLVTLFLSQHQPGEALRRLQVQMARIPDRASLEFLLAQTLIANQKLQEAQNALGQAIALDRNDVPAYLLLAQLQAAAGRLDDAAATMERSMRENPRDVRSFVDLGVYEERRENWQKAEDLYKKALQIQPNEPTAANNLSFLLVEHGGNLGYAVSLAQTARGEMPDSANAADTLGWAYYKLGAYDSSIPLFQEAIKKTPQNSTYHYHLGLAYQKEQKVEMARANFQLAIKLDPRSSRVDEIRKALEELDSPQ